jgi:hypothetical protein
MGNNRSGQSIWYIKRSIQFVIDTIELAHMTLCLAPKVLNAVDVVMLVSK